jgi:Fe-S oxidoreductase
MNSIASREILWNVPNGAVVALYVTAAIAGVWLLLWFGRRARRWARGGSKPRPAGDWKKGAARLFAYLVTHRTIRRDGYAGLMHALLFWGFVTELCATTLVGIQHHLELSFLSGATYCAFSLAADLGGVALLLGVGMALWRRRSPSAHGRLQRSSATTALLMLLLVVTVGGFFVEAARIAVTMPAFERWSPIGYALAWLLDATGMTADQLAHLHRYLWVGHAATAVAFIAVIPVSVMKHAVLGAYSVMRPAAPPGWWSAPQVEVALATGLNSFSRLDLVHADACLTCGRCTEVCPAEAAGKPLSPRRIVLGLRQLLDAPAASPFEKISDDELWACTTCHACETACPIDIRIVDKIAALRRGRVLTGTMADSAANALDSSAQRFNPFGKPNSTRMEWASGLSVPLASAGEAVDLLYWVGCAGAFDPAGREVTRAMVRILARLGVNYRVLGCRERCSGDPARRLGEEGLWEELARANQKNFATHAVKTILTQCAHCFNSFHNEYPALGATPRVMHHSQWLRERIAEGTLVMGSPSGDRITFHDPCYLARAGNEIEAPRAVLDQLSARVEMKEHGKKSFCCGGGGGQMWIDVRGRTRVETLRAGAGRGDRRRHRRHCLPVLPRHAGSRAHPAPRGTGKMAGQRHR